MNNYINLLNNISNKLFDNFFYIFYYINNDNLYKESYKLEFEGDKINIKKIKNKINYFNFKNNIGLGESKINDSKLFQKSLNNDFEFIDRSRFVHVLELNEVDRDDFSIQNLSLQNSINTSEIELNYSFN